MLNKKFFFLTLIIIIFIININIVITSTIDASYIFFTKVFVSVFPFIILSNILIYYNYHIFLSKIFSPILKKLFNISNNSVIVLILSMLSSAPANSIYIKNILDNNLMDEKEANLVLCFTYFPSISFIIGTVGYKMYNSIKIGILLLLLNYITNILIALYLRNKHINQNNNCISNTKTDFFNMLKTSILEGFNSCFIILGNLIIFIIIINIINKYFYINDIISSILSGSLEITNGLNQISLLNTNISLKISLTNFILNFSGLSIIFQSRSILSEYKINIKKILLIKIIFSLITSIILYFILITIRI